MFPRLALMFISFEGIDGSGKTTQARLLTEALRREGHDVVEVREPGGTRLGEDVRALLLDPEQDINARAELLLFSAARAQLVDQEIRPALDRGAVVVADRFFDSSTAYQGAGRGVATPTWLTALHDFATGGLSPSRTYLIDVPVDVAIQRRGPEADRMESAGVDFSRRVRQGYLDLAASVPDRILVIDALGRPEAVHDVVRADAFEMMGQR